MTFADGYEHNDAPLVYPNRYHPAAPLIPQALADALRIAYVVARHRGRDLVTQWFGDTHGAVYSTGLERIADSRAFVPREVTHLVAELAVRPAVTTGDVSIYAAVSVYDGTLTDTGSTTELVLESVPPVDIPAQPWAGRSPSDPLGIYGANVHVMRAEVELDTVTAGAVREVYVRAYAIDRRTSVPHSVTPLFVRVWWELR